MINLFEYQNKVGIADSLEGLEEFLDEIWNNREKNSFYSDLENKKESQKFLKFTYKSNELKSNKYVGVIHYNGTKINLLPKIFFDSKKDYTVEEVNQIQNHVLWWLSYCRKIKFPNYQTSLGCAQNSFFEVLIYLFSKYTRKLLNSSIYQQYEEIEHELSFIKGRLNTNTYINENLTKGKWHKLNCTYDAFVFDNEFNRIIKHVARLLIQLTSNHDNKRNLREIIFLMDEVSDVKVSAEQCSRIVFNPMFGEFETVRDYCQLFLSNSISFDYKNDLKLFAFLLPMEYLFEDFICGFINKELESVSVRPQRSDVYLDEEKIFNLKPDLWLQTTDRSLIADTKYKIIYDDEKDAKRGISQGDLYQMLAYAVRFEVNEIILFYPDTIKHYETDESELVIEDSFSDGKKIFIKAYQLPIINRQLLQSPLEINTELNELFEPTRIDLIARLQAIIYNSKV